MKKRAFAVVTLAATALAVPGLDAAPANKSTSAAPEPVQVCSTVYNPTNAYTVPVDRLLVIEDATVSANLDADEIVVGLIETTTGGVPAEHFAGRISGAVFRFDRDGRTMTVYADPGTDVIFKVARRNSPDNMEICFAGRLEPVTF